MLTSTEIVPQNKVRNNNANINKQNITKENSAVEVHSLGEQLAGRAATTEAAVTDSLGEQIVGRVTKPAADEQCRRTNASKLARRTRLNQNCKHTTHTQYSICNNRTTLSYTNFHRFKINNEKS
ncbi:hypothetical protein DEO72_LG9g1086 [Vigna unguiculata]|uniref:Uncharacterized protein n=1 Tax=Vigna unguiculata TaxID=3917 RepID=A0A4D6N248_VIGUN|nr:hypothetical protein DEO72_LG9g1086 [Vigna unguiculata]